MLRILNFILLPTVAFAQEAVEGSSVAGSNPYASLLPLVLIFGIFYFLLIKPQQKRMKEHQGMLEVLKKGDEVVTSGGLVGRVAKVETDRVMIEVAKGVEVAVMKPSVSAVVTASAKPAAAAKSTASKKTTKNDNVGPSKDQVANDN